MLLGEEAGENMKDAKTEYEYSGGISLTLKHQLTLTVTDA